MVLAHPHGQHQPAALQLIYRRSQHLEHGLSQPVLRLFKFAFGALVVAAVVVGLILLAVDTVAGVEVVAL